jgi:hypothetical protein
MKDCENCEYFDGYDYDDGTPNCIIKGRYENCPYNKGGSVKEDPFKITLDVPEINEFINHTISNTLHDAVYNMIDNQVHNVVRDSIKDLAKSYVEEKLKSTIDEEIASFMKKDITIGGGWGEAAKTISREQFLSDTISKELEKKLDKNAATNIVQTYCHGTIISAIDKLKSDVNSKIKSTFDEETRKALSDNIIQVLMAGDTFQRLSDSMGRLLK